MLPHPLTNFEIWKFYKNESRFNGVYSRDNLIEIKDLAYIVYLDKFSDIGTDWVALYIHNTDVIYFDSFGVEHIPKEIKTSTNRPLSFVLRPPVRDALQNKNIITNIFRIQAYHSNCVDILVLDFLIRCLKTRP